MLKGQGMPEEVGAVHSAVCAYGAGCVLVHRGVVVTGRWQHVGASAGSRCNWRWWTARGGACGGHMGQRWASRDGGCAWGSGCGGGGVGAGGAGHGETKSLKPGMMAAASKSWLLMLVVLVLMKQQVYLCCPWKLSPTPAFLS